VPVPVPEPEAEVVTMAIVSICDGDTATERSKPCCSPDTCSQPDTVDAVQCDIVSAERVKGLSHRSVKPCGQKRVRVFQEMRAARQWNGRCEVTLRGRRKE
jgi:hypothetical protein